MDHLYTYFLGFQMSEVTIQDEKEKLQSLITQNMAQDNEKVFQFHWDATFLQFVLLTGKLLTCIKVCIVCLFE